MYSPVKYYFGLTDNGYGVEWVVFVKIKDWLRKSIRFKGVRATDFRRE